MPELPEVETMRLGILGVVGQTIDEVVFPPIAYRPLSVVPPRRSFIRRSLGQQIVAVERKGKRILLKLAGGATILFEPRMTGLALVSDPPNLTHVHLVISLLGPGESRLLFWDRRGLGQLKLLSPQELVAELGPERLGPDALSVSGEMLGDRLGRSQRAVKVALLDQRAVAGIGNLYAVEILFDARIDPRTRCSRLSKAQWAQIASSTQQILSDAIAYEGSTLADGTYRNALNQDGSYQNHHRVYAREGERCVRCRTKMIRRIVQAQRSTFFCGHCQARR